MKTLPELINQLKAEKSKAMNDAESYRQKMEMEFVRYRAFDLAIDKAELLLKNLGSENGGKSLQDE